MYSTEEKLAILTDAAKYDVACTSSGHDRDAKLGHLGNTNCAGICHSFSADGRCITLLKVLMTNACIYDCAYCANKTSNDVPRAIFEPRELANLTIEFYRRNYIEGLFLSSGVVKNPDFTMELMLQTIDILRNEYEFLGYIHVKAIPGSSNEILAQMGFLVDRMSTNIELPSSQSLRLLAPNKTKESIFSPMGFISKGISDKPGILKHKQNAYEGADDGFFGVDGDDATKMVGDGSTDIVGDGSTTRANNETTEIQRFKYKERFVPAGQSTQIIIGATPESDYQILNLANSMYRNFGLKRVFFSAYLPINREKILPDESFSAPLDREHRLYQADWLMRFYNFTYDELIDENNPFLDTRIDPKANWALNNMHLFPVEINKAPYRMLIRVPGLGRDGAKKIIRARRCSTLSFDSLKQMGLSIKRMKYFITCSGKYNSEISFDECAIRKQLVAQACCVNKKTHSGGKKPAQGQLSLFDIKTLNEENLGYELGETSEPFQKAQLRAFQEQRKSLAKLNMIENKKHERIFA